jgi:hypothetical protein
VYNGHHSSIFVVAETLIDGAELLELLGAMNKGFTRAPGHPRRRICVAILDLFLG